MSFAQTGTRKKVSCEVLEDYGVVHESEGYELRVRLISWNGQLEKYDIRKWSTQDPDRCLKGLCLTKDEIEALTSALCDIQKNGGGNDE